MIKKKKGTRCPVDFEFPLDQSITIKKIEKIDLAREPKKMWNMRVTVIPFIICGPNASDKIGGIGNKRIKTI